MGDSECIPEQLVIRPPSEWKSLLVRITRGCGWNRCKFCGLYPHLGEPEFSARSVDDICHDITALRQRRFRVETAFLGDSDPLVLPNDQLAKVLTHLRETFPEISRMTCYARASTLWKKREAGIWELARLGLGRVHIGLESGDLDVLRFQRKGQTPRILIESGRWLKRAGIEISYYVLLGLGGRDRWQEHIDGSANIINEVNPEFVRLRRLWLYGEGAPADGPCCPLWADINEGRFTSQTADGTVKELRRLIEKLRDVTTYVTCDHHNNYVQVSGQMPEDRESMLAEVDAFLARPEAERQALYDAIGSRI